MAKRPFCVPFQRGSMCSYAGYVLSDAEEQQCFAEGSLQMHADRWDGGHEWKPNKPFKTTLFYDGFARGRSSAGFRFKDADGHVYWMFMTDLDDAIRTGAAPLQLSGTFEFAKRGANYGVRLVELENDA